MTQRPQQAPVYQLSPAERKYIQEYNDCEGIFTQLGVALHEYMAYRRRGPDAFDAMMDRRYH